MKKRILALILICLLYLLPAAADTPVTISVSDGQAAPGQTVTVAVNFAQATEVAGFVLEADYDHDSMELVDVTLADPQSWPDGSFSFNPETDQFTWAGYENISLGDGTWCYLHFSILPEALRGSYPISLHIKDNEPTNLVSASGNSLNALFSEGSITVGVHRWTLTSETVVNQQANTATTSIRVSNFDPKESKSVSVVIAAYASNGQMLQAQMIPVTLIQGQSSMDFRFNSIPSQIRCYLLDNSTSAPLTEATTWPK